MDSIEVLVTQSIEGNEESFRELFDMSFKTIFFKVDKIVMDESTAMDIVQNTYIKAYNNLGKLKEPRSFLKWLNTIANNETMDYLKKNKDINLSALDSEDGSKIFEIEDESLEYQPEAQVDIEETREIMNKIIKALPETQRMTIMMFYFDELKTNEIAEVMEVSENTVKSRLRYAKSSIEESVRNLEKTQGIRLYGFGPIAYFIWAIKETAKKQTFPAFVAPAVTQAGGVMVGGSVSKGKIVSTIVKTLKPTTLAAKAVATTAIVGTLAISGAAVINKLPSNDVELPPIVNVEDSEQEDELLEEETNQTVDAGNDTNHSDETTPDKPNQNSNPKPAPYIPTAREKKSVEQANKDYEEYKSGPYWIIDRNTEIEALIRAGFTEKEAIYGADNSKFDWNQELVNSARYFQNIAPKSYKGLIEDLLQVHTNPKDAKYAADNLKVDWKNQPMVYAKWLSGSDSFSRAELENFPINHGLFTVAERDFIVKNFKIDWSAQAVIYMKKHENIYDSGSMRDKMKEVKFTDAEVDYAFAENNIIE